MTDHKSFTKERDRQNTLMNHVKRSEQNARLHHITQINERRPDYGLYRTWELWPEVQAYYPSLAGAVSSSDPPF